MERGEDKDARRRRGKRGGGKKEEKRRLQLACRGHQKNGEPHAPTQRRPTSKNTADWSAKLREKARKKKGRGFYVLINDNAKSVATSEIRFVELQRNK